MKVRITLLNIFLQRNERARFPLVTRSLDVSGYNTLGQTGINGDGYAYGEPNDWGNDGGGGCTSCSEELNDYTRASKQAEKKAKRHSLAMDRKDNHHKQAQSQQMSSHSVQE